MASVGSQTMYVFITNYCAFFFTDFLGISAGVAGTIFMVSRIWDGINDPMCGILVEKSNPKHGKIQTWMFFGGIFTAVGLVMVFTVPKLSMAGRIAWGAVSYNIVGMAFTAATVAAMLQMARGTANPKERVSLSMSYTVASSIAGIFLGVMITKCLEIFSQTEPARGYWMTAVISSAGGMLFLLVSIFLFRDQVGENTDAAGEKEESPKVAEMLKAVLKIPSFLIMVLGPSIVNFGYWFVSGSMMYYLTYCKGNPGLMAMALPAMYIGLLAGSILSGYLYRFGKIRMMQLSYLIMAGAGVIRMVTGDNTAIFILGYAATAFGSGVSTTYLMPSLAECADYAEYKTGVRCQALSLTGFTLCSKMAGGLATAVLGFAMQFSGYDGTAAVQTESAVKMIRAVHFWPIIILGIIGAVIVGFYKLDDKTMEEVRAAKAKAEL